MERFQNRHHAGILLADKLKQYLNNTQVLVLGLPRGGIPIAYEIAKALHVSFDALLVRKLGVPGHEELAMGAIAADGIPVFNQQVLSQLYISQQQIQKIISQEQKELNRRKTLYCNNRDLPDLKNKIIILADDGIATGTTMLTAIHILTAKHPNKIIVAIPVAAPSACQEIAQYVNEVICLQQPEWFQAVGEWYDDFTQTTDAEVCSLLTLNTTKILTK